MNIEVTIMEVVPQINGLYTLLLSPVILITIQCHITFRRFGQRKCHSVIRGPRVYHDSINSGYYVAKPKNFANYSELEAGRVVS